MTKSWRMLSSWSARLATGAALAVALVGALPAWAGDLVIENTAPEASAEYWTAERMASARPMPLPRFDEATANWSDFAAPEAAGEAVGADGARPSAKFDSSMSRRLFEPDAEMAAAWRAMEELEWAEAAPENVGTAGAQFSSSRVFPDSATTTYPYLTVGKLFFRQPGVGNFICSASVIRRRLILTAGHCVHKGSGGQSGFFDNFQFVPAYRNGVAPVGTWTWAYAIVTNAWATGNGNVPNAGDYALIEPNDLNGSVIGNVTGFLGYQTSKLNPNHVHIIGYPANLDSGNRMHQVTAQSFKNAAPNTVQFGSDMRGGSSGGPFVQNFGVVSAGQTGGSNSGSNRVVSVVSYGPVAVGPFYQGGSILDSQFTGILNTACAHRAGNC